MNSKIVIQIIGIMYTIYGLLYFFGIKEIIDPTFAIFYLVYKVIAGKEKAKLYRYRFRDNIKKFAWIMVFGGIYFIISSCYLY